MLPLGRRACNRGRVGLGRQGGRFGCAPVRRCAFGCAAVRAASSKLKTWLWGDLGFLYQAIERVRPIAGLKRRLRPQSRLIGRFEA